MLRGVHISSIVNEFIKTISATQKRNTSKSQLTKQAIKKTKATIFHTQKLQLEIVLVTSFTIPLTSDTWESLDIVLINNLVSFGMKLLCVLDPLNLFKKNSISFFRLTGFNYFYFFRWKKKTKSLFLQCS